MYEKLIAAVDLGTSKMTLMVGKKDVLDLLTITAVESVESNGCIRRGCIYNVEETTAKLKALLDKVNSKINPKIEKVYVGIGGQSVRSMEHTVSRQLPPEAIVDKELLDSIMEECMECVPDELLARLDITSPEYYIDGRPEPNPLGVKCSEIEVRYQMIVGRPNIKRDITISIAEKGETPIAGYIISAEATATAVLTPAEKDLGCALVDMGAGTTTLSIYKHNLLRYMVTIPLGSDLITQDICSLGILDTEAEEFKKEFGQAVADNGEEISDKVFTTQKVDAGKLNQIIEARMDEILANVMAQVEYAGFEKSLASGMVITGGAANLKKLYESVKDKTHYNVRIAGVQKALLAEETDITKNLAYSGAIGLLVMGEENCAKETAFTQTSQPKNLFDDEVEIVRPVRETRKPPKEEKKEEKKDRGGLFKNLSKKFEGAARSLFDEEEEE